MIKRELKALECNRTIDEIIEWFIKNHQREYNFFDICEKEVKDNTINEHKICLLEKGLEQLFAMKVERNKENKSVFYRDAREYIKKEI